MLVRMAVLAAVMSVVGTWVEAQDLSGNRLLKNCIASDKGSEGFCFGYIIGTIEGLMVGGALEVAKQNPQIADLGDAPLEVVRYCIPSGVTKGQLQDVVVAYLNDHPAERHELAPVLVHRALSEAFPC